VVVFLLLLLLQEPSLAYHAPTVEQGLEVVVVVAAAAAVDVAGVFFDWRTQQQRTMD
jgi:hypothetical protein